MLAKWWKRKFQISIPHKDTDLTKHSPKAPETNEELAMPQDGSEPSTATIKWVRQAVSFQSCQPFPHTGISSEQSRESIQLVLLPQRKIE